MRACKRCGGELDRAFRFCPWCAAPQRMKLVEFFQPHPLIERDRGKALRVSRYLGLAETEQRHVRFSVWNEHGVAEAALSLSEKETRRLVAFLLAPEWPLAAPPRTLTAALGRWRSELSERIGAISRR
jgi:hypothetical protein